MKRKVTILCSNLKGNLGDFAIAEAVATAAIRYLGKCQFFLYYHANKPVDEKRLEAMLSESNVVFESILPAPYYRRPYWLRTFCRLGIAQSLYSKWHNQHIAKVAKFIAGHRDFMNHLHGSDLVVFAGGAQWGRGDLNLNMFAQLQAVSSLGKKCHVFPFSVSSGLKKCNGSEALSGLFTHLTRPLFVRDSISHDTLQSVGVDAQLVCDSVFSLKNEFQTSWDLNTMPSDCRDTVYVSLTQSGSPSLQSVSDLLASISAYGLRPVLFSSCELEDRSFYDSLQELAGVDAVYPTTWKQAVARLAECRFVITNRLHCLIFSALSGTPIVPVTNRLKSEAYVSDADLPCSLKAPAALTSDQIDDINRRLPEISLKQKTYADACASILDRRLSELFIIDN
jgi:polysaccharide pyruvyl transferase WcaK-like protein